jgi:CheY-like chemotaxis protein
MHYLNFSSCRALFCSEKGVCVVKVGGAVLVVDDEPGVREVAVDLFEALGLKVYEAYNGEQALRLLLAHEDIGVLFTDVRMYPMNGVELARQAQQIRPDVKVVLTSGYMGEAPDAPDLPMVPKPWRKDDVAGLLAGLSGRKKGNGSDRSA